MAHRDSRVFRWLLLVVVAMITAGPMTAAQPPVDPHRRYFELGDFTFESGVVLPKARTAYATFGTLNADKSNVVLAPSWYGSDHHGYDFLLEPGAALDPARYFVVATEMFANGFSSSPSNTPAPFDGPRFPAVAIRDNVEAARRLLQSEFGVSRLHAIVGFSMGAQQAFQWAVSHPGAVARIVPYCGTAKTYPHGQVRLESAIAALTADPVFNGGNYTTPPRTGMAAWSKHWAAWVYSQEWWRRELFRPRASSVDEALAQRVERDAPRDANNLIAQARTWQRHNVGDTSGFGGDHERALRSIEAQVLYMPCETDLYFPIGDASYEAAFLRHGTLRPIPSLWGHSAGGGANPDDNAFISAAIRDFLR